MKVTIECPLCGYKNRITAALDDTRWRLMLCDCDEGGCDKYFVADVAWRAHVTIYKLTLVDTPAPYQTEVEG